MEAKIITPKITDDDGIITRIECSPWLETHLHIRQGPMLRLVLPYSIRQAGAAIIMPNVPMIATTTDADALLLEITDTMSELQHLNASQPISFKPLLTCYLRDTTDADDLIQGFNKGTFHAAKLYPVGATTGSDEGVTDIKKIVQVLKRMAAAGLPLCLHGEQLKNAAGKRYSSFGETEKAFLDDVLSYIIKTVPDLRIHLEHISTGRQATFVLEHDNVFATITPQHLMYTIDDYVEHNGKRKFDTRKMCLPTLKYPTDIQSIMASISISPHKFAAGTDSAPHDVSTKGDDHGGCNCGSFNAPTALEMYATIFDQHDMLKLLPQFLTNGWGWYGLKPPQGKTIILERGETKVPALVKSKTGDVKVTPLNSGNTLPWKLAQPANDIEIATSVY